MIKIICVGKIKEAYMREAIADYTKRLKKYTKLEIIELVDSNISNESQLILSKISTKDYIITLEINSQALSSVELAQKIDELNTKGLSNITFIIGGSDGLHDNIKKLANFHLSFSTMTFPHQLFRLLLLEQLYRSFKILKNESYHK